MITGLFLVFSVDMTNEKMVVTRGEHEIRIVYLDGSATHDRMVFKRTFDKILAGQHTSVAVDGEVDEAGNIKAKNIKEFQQ